MTYIYVLTEYQILPMVVTEIILNVKMAKSLQYVRPTSTQMGLVYSGKKGGVGWGCL